MGLQKQKNPELKKSRYPGAEQSPGYQFWRAYNSWQRKMRQELDPIEITQVQFSILATASYLGSCSKSVSQQNISTHLAMDKMMVSDVLKNLIARKYVVRKKSTVDLRAFDIRLTTKGMAQLQKTVPVAEQADEDFFDVLSPNERRRFIASLKKLSSG